MADQINAESNNSIWIDVRTPEEYSIKNIPGHINIPHDVIDARISELNLDSGQEIKLYCRTGRRSGVAAQTLEALGFYRVENVGSIEAAMDILVK